MHKVYVVGIGPGTYEQMTIQAANILKECDIIIGYSVYVDLIKNYFPEKKFMTTPMRKEADRCRIAFEEAKKGQSVAMICSGDAGVYGMAGLMYEIRERYYVTSDDEKIEISVIPGVTAALSGAAVLGAPLIHDFCLISLSDLLTPWEKIENRLLAAAEADFVICLYNPSSHKRKDYLEKACNILLTHKAPETVCAVVRQIGRDGEEATIMDLTKLMSYDADMFSTIFIGNSSTKVIDGKMVTPRGYHDVEGNK